MRIGFGYDVHRLVENRSLIIGGVNIPFRKGLLGHSDADVLIHSIMDGILGALALRDIGYQFPDSDPKYKDISSMLLLKEVKKLMTESGYEIGNIDATVALESPKLKDYINSMRENIADILNTNISNISIKATTTEGMSFVGEGQGASAYCVVLLKSIVDK